MKINKIYNEDCLETMQRMPDNFVDYVLTSPPYNIGGNNMNDNSRIEKTKNNKESKYKNLYYNYDDDNTNYKENQFKIINELLRVTKNHIFYNIQMLGGNKEFFFDFISVYKKNIKDVIIWNKNPIPHINKGVINSAFEFIIILSNQNPEKKTFTDGNFKGNFNNIIKLNKTYLNKYSQYHKAVMQIELARILIQKFGDENDIWYDCFNGVGTSSIASIKEKRNFLGSEVSEKYVEISNERIKKEINQTKLF
tara:strand:- start:790 stop:1545 length:756 start_codon:yes stop_codon:yes gene_type:complete